MKMSTIKIVTTLILAVGLLTAKCEEPKANRLKQGEVLRVWKKEAPQPEEKAECRVGDTIIVEVRDVVGWLMDSLDNGVFNDDPMVKDLKPDSIVFGLVGTGQLHKAVKFINPALTLIRTKEMSWEDAFADVQKDAGLGSLPKFLPKNTTKEKVDEVMKFVSAFKKAKIAKFTLELDRDTVSGVSIRNPSDGTIPSPPRTKETEDNDYSWYEFRLDVLPANADLWSRLRSAPAFRRPVSVTLALDVGGRVVELPTRVAPGVEGGFDFGLNLIPRGRFASALGLWLVAAVLLLKLGGSTDLLRDPDGEIRPDGRRCFSLARSQMACWFLLVVGAFLFLWVVTGSYDTLNDTCLWLIGIGTGTALGAAFITDPKQSSARKYPHRVPHEVSDANVHAELEKEATAAEELAAGNAKDQDGNKIPADVAVKVLDGNEIPAKVYAASVKRQIAAHDAFLNKTSFKRMLDDFLIERDLYSFHRYQMLVWTIAMALVFVVEVWRGMKMPVFNMTALALMGISSGTYLGFKLKEQEPAKK